MLRNEEYAILKWFAELESVDRARPGSTCPSSTPRRSPRATACDVARADSARRAAARRCATAIASSEPVARRGAGGARHGARLRTLLAPDPGRIGRPPGRPGADRAPDSLAAGTPEPLRSELDRLLGADRVLARALDLVRYASDASPYRLFPKAVVMARDAADVAKVFALRRAATGTP